jgi:hypothetical protein
MSICCDLIDSGQWQLFWGRMWICVNICEYLVILSDKTIVHEIIDCNSIWKMFSYTVYSMKYKEIIYDLVWSILQY